jgi:hypothetical protein
MAITNVAELKEYFRRSKAPGKAQVYTNTAVRRQWMLEDERTIINGKVYDIAWTNMSGGVWLAQLCSPRKILF